MNRTLRKRAKRLRKKAADSLAKMNSGDLQTVSNRMSSEQYCSTLELFETPQFKTPSELARHLASSLMSATEKMEEEQVPNFVPACKFQEIDCCAGCACCCHEPLQVSILDAISVAAHLLDQGKASEALPGLQEYEASIAHLGSSRESLKQSFDPCPFLDPQNRCTVYSARPVICRAFHSTNVGRCEEIVDQESPNRDVPMFTGLFGFRGLRLTGARKALKDLGLDDRPVVLARAVKLLLQDFDGIVEAWLDGKDCFDNVAVI